MGDPLTTAVEALQEHLGSSATIKEEKGTLLVRLGKQSARFPIRTAPPLNKQQAALLVSRSEEELRDKLLVSKRITEGAAALLREKDLSYLDHAGNAFLHAEGLLVHIAGKEPVPLSSQSASRAFKKSGLKLIFALLCDPALLRLPYRDMCALVDISHGAARYVVEDLVKQGFVAEVGDDRAFQNREELIERWTIGFSDTLRPRLLRSRYRFRSKEAWENWKNVDLSPIHSLWSGEAAADLLTGQLRPEQLTIYSDEDSSTLLQELKALPDEEGPIEVLDLFWDAETLSPAQETSDTAPLLLVYADLLSSGSARNAEVAQTIYDRFLSG